MGWTGRRNSTCTCSASSRRRGTARSWTSAGGANAPCWRGSSSRGTRWSRPIGWSTASGATSRPPTPMARCRPTSATSAGGSSPTRAPGSATESSRGPDPATCCAWHRTPSTRGSSRPRSRRRPGWHPGTRCARWSPRCGCGGDRRTPTTPASRGPRRRSPGSPSCAGSPANACSRRASSSARPSSSSATSRRWSRRTRCGRSAGGCWRSRSTGPTARPPRSKPCGGHERCSPTSSAWIPGPPCVPSRRRSSPSRRTSTGRGPQRPRHRRR